MSALIRQAAGAVVNVEKGGLGHLWKQQSCVLLGRLECDCANGLDSGLCLSRAAETLGSMASCTSTRSYSIVLGKS